MSQTIEIELEQLHTAVENAKLRERARCRGLIADQADVARGQGDFALASLLDVVCGEIDVGADPSPGNFVPVGQSPMPASRPDDPVEPEQYVPPEQQASRLDPEERDFQEGVHLMRTRKTVEARRGQSGYGVD